MKWLALLAVLAAGTAWAGKPVKSKQAGGDHIRLETANGAVHVWVPPGYRPETAGIALYVHGYYTNVDRAWKDHRLAEQFAASGRNAIFIAPEAPDGLAQPVFWTELDELLQEVTRQTGLRRPWGPVVAMVHSGGYRTAAAWLDDELVDDLVLLDALYGEEQAFADWSHTADHQLILLGADTLRWTEPFARENDVRHYLRSGVSHMGLVTKGKTIPLLYRMTRLPAVAPVR